MSCRDVNNGKDYCEMKPERRSKEATTSIELQLFMCMKASRKLSASSITVLYLAIQIFCRHTADFSRGPLSMDVYMMNLLRLPL